MNLHWMDWLIVAVFVGAITATAVALRRYMKSVSDFLAANRCAGRYLLAVSMGMSSLGAISVLAKFEMFYGAGFTADWWTKLMAPVVLLIALSGFVTYRLRETRAMTIAQFYEMRYSRRFRVFCGVVAWVSGILNMGIFPAVGANFFMYFLGLPQYTFELFGGEVNLTYASLMLLLLSISVFFVFAGGQIVVMVTDFLQGVFTNVVMLAIIGVFFWFFDWSQIVSVLKTAPAEASKLDPMKTSQTESFNVWFFLLQALAAAYHYRAWQGSQAYNWSARNAHEQKFAGILGEWRAQVMLLLTMLVPIGAWVVMHGESFSGVAASAQAELDTIPNDAVRNQMTTPLVLVHILPVGVMGLMAALMVAAFISTHNTYLHSWGSIFVQDVILPFRRKPFTTRQHFWLLRLSICFVALFIFCFSMMFNQLEEILMFFHITGAIYLGGAGSVIIGGLYWKHGSTRGAWGAMICGAGMASGGLIARQLWSGTIYPFLDANAPWALDGLAYVLEGVAAAVPGIHWQVGPDSFPMSGVWVSTFAIIGAVLIYVGMSLFDAFVLRRPAQNMDKLLHRGDYAVSGDHVNTLKPATGLRAILPTIEFNRRDKLIYYLKLVWSLGWVVVFLGGTGYALTHTVSLDAWAMFWWYKVMITLAVGAATVIWFSIGGAMDMRYLFRALGSARRDYDDTGMVSEDDAETIAAHTTPQTAAQRDTVENTAQQSK